MSTSAEKLVKQAIKTIAKTQELDYEELKVDVKKIIKSARNYDEYIMGMMEEIMDLSNVSSPEELEDFNIEVLKIYCRIKELGDSGSDRSIKVRVWKNIEEEMEESDPESDLEAESEEEEEEEEDAPPEEIHVPEPPDLKSKKSKPTKAVKADKADKADKAEREVVIIG